VSQFNEDLSDRVDGVHRLLSEELRYELRRKHGVDDVLENFL